MHSNPPSTAPRLHGDGTFSAVVLGSRPYGSHGRLVTLALPASVLAEPACGRFFLARCVEDTPAARATDWSLYLRRPLLVAGPAAPNASGDGQRLDLWVGPGDATAQRWLALRPPGSTLNLTGPFGQPFAPHSTTRALLVLTGAGTLPIWLPAVHTVLDRGGRVTLVVAGDETPDRLLPHLPLAVELRIAPTAADWEHALAETLRWADQVCASLPLTRYQPLADQVRLARFRMEPGFVHVFVPADLVCGYGACLACAVPLPDGGMTRACLHGPIFPLDRIAK